MGYFPNLITIIMIGDLSHYKFKFIICIFLIRINSNSFFINYKYIIYNMIITFSYEFL